MQLLRTINNPKLVNLIKITPLSPPLLQNRLLERTVGIINRINEKLKKNHKK
jgi:hypothetical protein